MSVMIPHQSAIKWIRWRHKSKQPEGMDLGCLTSTLPYDDLNLRRWQAYDTTSNQPKIHMQEYKLRYGSYYKDRDQIIRLDCT